jgi:hypothetical protein
VSFTIGRQFNKVAGRRRDMGRKLLVCIVAVAFLASTIGCASIFYPSRVGQQTHGPIDVGMLVVDILLTGLIGIVVDLITGAIYLPASYCLPAGDYDINLDPSQLGKKVESMTLPQTGDAEFSLPVRAASGDSHHVSLTVITKEGVRAASARVIFDGSGEWQKVGSKLEISAGDATSGVMRVSIDGIQRAELPVRFVQPAK